MVGLLIDLTPVKLKKLQKQLELEARLANRKVKTNKPISTSTNRTKFQTD